MAGFSPSNQEVARHDFFGPGGRLHHVGVAVQSIRELSPSSETVLDEEAGVTMAFVDVHGVTIELLEPYGEKSPIARNLKEGVKLLHLCYEVPAIENAIAICRLAGFHQIRAPRPTPVYENRLVAWVFSKEYGVFELLEQRREDSEASTANGS